MTNTIFTTSYALLWLLNIATFVAVVVLYRYHGQLLIYGREGREVQGPPIGKRAAEVSVVDTAGRPVALGAQSQRPKIVLFASARCPSCVEAPTVLERMADEYGSTVDTFLICAGRGDEAVAYRAKFPQWVRTVADRRADVATQWRIGSVPFAIALDEAGYVRAKANAISDESIESLVRQAAGLA